MRQSKRLRYVALLAGACVTLAVALWLLRSRIPRGREWVASGAAVESRLKSGVLFTDSRIVPLVRRRYESIVDSCATVYTKLLGSSRPPPLEIYFFAERDSFLRFGGTVEHSTRAFFAPASQAIYVYGNYLMGPLVDVDGEASLRHELVHAIVHGVWGEVPIWLDEALASHLSRGVVESERWHAGIPHWSQITAVRNARDRGELPALEELLSMAPREFYELGHQARGHATLFLIFLEEQARFEEFLEELGRRPPPRDASAISGILRTQTSRSIAELDRAFLEFLDRSEDLVDYARASALAADFEHARAIPLSRRAVERRPDRGEYWQLLGLCLHLEEGAEKALEAYERAIRCAPFESQRTTMITVANSYYDQGRVSDSLSLYETVLETGLPTPTILRNLAYGYKSADPEKALEFVRQGLSLPRGGPLFAAQFEDLESLEKALLSRGSR